MTVAFSYVMRTDNGDCRLVNQAHALANAASDALFRNDLREPLVFEDNGFAVYGTTLETGSANYSQVRKTPCLIDNSCAHPDLFFLDDTLVQGPRRTDRGAFHANVTGDLPRNNDGSSKLCSPFEMSYLDALVRTHLSAFVAFNATLEEFVFRNCSWRAKQRTTRDGPLKHFPQSRQNVHGIVDDCGEVSWIA